MPGDATFPEVLREDEFGPRPLPLLRRTVGGRRRSERIGRREDPAFGADRDAERRRGAGDPEQRVPDELAVVLLFGDEGDEVLEGPGIRTSGRVGRGEDVGSCCRPLRNET